MSRRNQDEEDWGEDRRGFGRRGGGRGRRNFDRGYRRDDNRGFKRKRHEYEQQNRAPEMTAGERLRKLLIRVGEKSKSPLAKNLDGLAKAVQRDIQSYEDLILATLFDCVIHLGIKVPIHATLVGLITIWEPEFGAKVLSRLSDCLVKSIKDSDVFKMRHYVRFLGCLHNANVVLPTDFLNVLRSLLSQLKREELPTNHCDHLVHIVLSCLVFAGHSLRENFSEDLSELLITIGDYMDNREDNTNQFMQPIKDQEFNFILDYWQAMQELEKKDWLPESVIAPHHDFERLKRCSPQEFVIEIPNLDAEATISSLNEFCVLQLVKPEEEQPLYEIIIVCEYIHDLLKVFHQSPEHCAEHIIQLPLTFEPKFLAMEAIFSRMLSLPQPNYNYTYYARIIIQLFEKDRKVWPKAVGRCLVFLFDNMQKLDVEVRDRLAYWFAFHLNNFSNNWPWHKWNFVVSSPENSPKRQFCVQVLRLQVHLCDWERVMNSLQDPFNNLMIEPPRSTLKYNLKIFETPEDGTKNTNQIAADIVRMLNKKLSVDDIRNHLDTWIDPSQHGQYAYIEVLTTCLLHVGQSSYSHFLSYFKTYNPLLREYLNPEVKVVIIRCICQFWEKSQDRIITIVEKMQQYKFIDSLSIITFIFLPENCSKHADPFWMKLLSHALDRVFLTNNGLKSRKEIAQRRLKDTNLHEQDIEETETKLQQIEKALKQMKPILGKALKCLYGGFTRHLKDLIDTTELVDENYLFQAQMGNLIWMTRKYQSSIEDHYEELNGDIFAHCDDKVKSHWDEYWQLSF